MKEYSLAADPILVSGPEMAVFVLVVVFAMVAYSEKRWFVGAGLAVVAVVVLGALFSWATLADYPLVYGKGDFPAEKTELTSLYYKWELKAGENVDTVLVGEAPADAGHLAGELSLEFGCDDAARVGWHLDVDGDRVDSGTLHDGQSHDLAGVAVAPNNARRAVRLTADRRDSATCVTTLNWRNPGFEGPGNGGFRFIFPGLPDGP
jgi:hypothetical protein